MLQQYPCSILKTMETIVREIPVIFVQRSGPPLWGQMIFWNQLCSVPSKHLSDASRCPCMRHIDFTGNMCAQVWALQSRPEARGWSTLMLDMDNLVNLLHTSMKSSHTGCRLQWPKNETLCGTYYVEEFSRAARYYWLVAISTVLKNFTCVSLFLWLLKLCNLFPKVLHEIM